MKIYQINWSAKHYAIFITCVLMLFLLFYKPNINTRGLGLVVLKDTIYTEKVVLKPTEPIITYIYRPDTNLRKQIVDTTVIVDIVKTRNVLEVTTIDTKSIVKTEEYRLPKLWFTYTITANGNVKIKRKWLPRVIVGSLLIGTSILIVNQLKN